MSVINLEQYCQKGERLYITFVDGDNQCLCIGGQVIQIIGDALIFKVKTSTDYDRTLVIYKHRIHKIEDLRKNQIVG